jgi:hypothetical protein
MATAIDNTAAASATPDQGEPRMNRNLQPPHRRSRSLARPQEMEKDMWRGYFVVAGTALALIAVWAALVLFSA